MNSEEMKEEAKSIVAQDEDFKINYQESNESQMMPNISNPLSHALLGQSPIIGFTPASA
jgi:hypothetical protein